MRKLVNGRIVDIKNIELFEKACEGAAIGRTISSALPTDSLGVDLTLVDKCISAYKKMYKLLPYPMYDIDSDIKYCAAGLFIQKELGEELKAYVHNGLYILLNEEKHLALGFVNYSWAIVEMQAEYGALDIREYEDSVGFEEYIWALYKMFTGESLASFYSTFMPKFIEACGNKSLVIKWELGNILSFGQIPERMEFEPNRIVNIETGDQYTLDVYCSGTRKTKGKGKEQITFRLGANNPNDEISIQEISEESKVYSFNLYKKSPINSGTHNAGKSEPADIPGVKAMFCRLCSIKNTDGSTEFPEYCGVIVGDYLVFYTNRRLFVTKSTEFSEIKEVARQVEMYSIKEGTVYLCKPSIIAPGIRKEFIYSYSLMDGNLRLCKIQFTRISSFV